MYILFVFIILLNAFTVAGEDYTAIMAMFTVNQMSPSTTKRVEILDNDDHDGNKKFFLRIQGECGVDVWVEICVWDDEWGMLHCLSDRIGVLLW